LINILRESKIAPERVEFELTETAVIRDFAQASICLKMLKEAGVKISLDDFGTGYSGLNQIHNLPLDKIKIDQAFVRSLAPNDSRRSIISLIVSLCRELKLTCVVEGVETESQYELLTDLGCEQMQGYLFSRPVDAASALQLIAGGLKDRIPVAGRDTSYFAETPGLVEA
jgi:EAL domain-containing protein (putative c-di-GMP-specific phosphodiesterase class I)